MKNGNTFVEMKNITKYFTDVKANDNISIDINEGEVLSILGENGAGKSTLMNILYGLYEPSAGEIFIRGKKVEIDSPKDAISQGIGMVHQHFMLVPTHTVVENLILGLDDKKGALNLKEAAAEISKISNELGFDIDPFSRIDELPVGVQQRVEILKSIYRGAELLIMDEPTAVLTPQETDELFKLLDEFVKNGNSVVLITHKLNEVMAISDRVTVLRDGQYIDTVNKEDTSEAELANMMVGRDISLDISKDNEHRAGETVLKLDNITSYDENDNRPLDGLSLELKRGEIYGIAGVSGNGQEELARILAGLKTVDEGNILLKDHDVSNLNSREMIENKVSYIPADRQSTGLILDMSIRENLILKSFYKPPFSSNGFINREKTRENAINLIDNYNIKTPHEETLTKNLSGGHQQKVVVARELSLDPEVIIAFQPTRGLDIGAIKYVHQLLVEARDQGKSVLLISTELPEVFNLSDRIGVIYQGQILKQMSIEDATIEEVGLLMAGVSKGSEN